MVLLVGGYALLLVATWAPATPGPDQNGYVVGAKQLARTGSMALVPRDADGAIDPMQYVCKIWIPADFGTTKERYYPKYPVGLPLLLAGAYRLGGVAAVYAVGPLATILGLIGSYLLARRLLGSVGAVLVVLILCSSVATHLLAHNVKSHAPAACLVVWGMHLLFRWFADGRWCGALGAGFLLGAAVTIRYSEGLMVLPMLCAVVLRLREHGGHGREWAQALAMLAVWALPGFLVLVHNLVAFGAVTGYDASHESSGFYLPFFWRGFKVLWQHQMAEGIGWLYVLGLAGVIAALASNWRTGLLLAVWVLPTVLLHATYYYVALADYGMHTRFVHSVLPGLLIGAVGLLFWPARRLAGQPASGRWGMVATYATAVAVVAYVGYQAAELPGRVRTWYQDRALLEQRTRQVLAHVPSNAVLFADGQSGLNHLQAVADYVLYATRTWLPPKPIWTGVDAGQEAREIDTRRPDRIQAFAAGKSLEQLVSARDTVIRTWLRAGRPVYLCLTGRATSAGDWPVAPDSDLELVPVDAGTDAPDTARLGIYQVLLRPDGPDHRHGPP